MKILLLTLFAASVATAGPGGTIKEYHIDVSDVIFETEKDIGDLAARVCIENGERYERHVTDFHNADLIVFCSTGGI